MIEQSWTTDLDIRFQQDVPLPGLNHRLKIFIDLENVLNWFGDTKNVQQYKDGGDVGEAIPILDAALINGGTQYAYSNFNPGGSKPSDFNPVIRDVDDSVWRLQLGFKYMFGGQGR